MDDDSSFSHSVAPEPTFTDDDFFVIIIINVAGESVFEMHSKDE
jgi:hypothetical protein